PARPVPDRVRLESADRCMLQILHSARIDCQPDLTVSERSLKNFRRTTGTQRKEKRMARTLEATPRRAGAGGGDRRKWWVLAAMVFGLFMPMLDNLVVNTALPTIQRDLSTGVSGLQWIIDAYVLAFASFMLTGGALG